jgi:hypothetical protein
MGYHSSPLVSFLLTLFNARLGAWLGNPGAAGERTYRRDAPGCSLIPLVKELFGLTDENRDYVYLSDGGHFDNTGIYEMVRRRCRIILVSDAGCDPKFAFEDLGNAVRKVRIDLGVSIELEKMRLYPRAGGGTSAYCAMGNIRYDRMGGKPGILFYLKPALGAQEPIDVRNYATTSPPFPHESTSDQWFSETQFESYRMLGRHIISSICDGDLEDLDFENLKDRVRRYLAGIEAPQGQAAGPGVS